MWKETDKLWKEKYKNLERKIQKCGNKQTKVERNKQKCGKKQTKMWK